MKQFQYTTPSGEVFGPYSVQQVRDFRFEVANGVLALDAGQSWTDSEGDTWTVVGAPPVVSGAQRDERLERIATAALQGLCANSYDGHLNRPLSTASYAEMAEIAVEHAKALIAELDKQA